MLWINHLYQGIPDLFPSPPVCSMGLNAMALSPYFLCLLTYFAVSGMKTQTHLLSQYHSMLLDIGNVRFDNKLTWIAFFHSTNPSIQRKIIIIMIYNMLEFHFLTHMLGPRFIELNMSRVLKGMS